MDITFAQLNGMTTESLRATNWRVAPSYLSPVEVEPTALDANKAIF